MNINAGIKGKFNQPPAKHKASPTIGNHEKNSVHKPLALTTFSAFCFSEDNSVSTGNFLAAKTPKPQVVIAPKVLPSVAANISFSIRKFPVLTIYAKTASDPPGAIVEEIKALTNSSQRPTIIDCP